MKKKMFQNVRFRDVDDFFEFIPGSERKIVDALRNLVFHCIPDCKEKLSYNVPFYSRHSRICFIWPSSVKWGNSKPHGVRLGFANGYLLQDEINYLDKGERKQVYWRDFYTPGEIDSELVKAYLFEAAEVDEAEYRRKKAGIDAKITTKKA